MRHHPWFNMYFSFILKIHPLLLVVISQCCSSSFFLTLSALPLTSQPWIDYPSFAAGARVLLFQQQLSFQLVRIPQPLLKPLGHLIDLLSVAIHFWSSALDEPMILRDRGCGGWQAVGMTDVSLSSVPTLHAHDLTGFTVRGRRLLKASASLRQAASEAVPSVTPLLFPSPSCSPLPIIHPGPDLPLLTSL